MDVTDPENELGAQGLYKPLQTPTEIRIIRVKANKSSDPAGILECDLDHIDRSKDVSYVALSYTWGDGTEKRPILVNRFVVYVGVNLENALRTLRDHFQIWTIWADQLCIHQADDAEKSQQVQQMKDIFAGADQVIAWLGVAADSSDDLLMRLRQLGDAVGNPKSMRKVRRLYAKKPKLGALAEAFDQFCKRRYWSRLWVLQEFAVATKLTIVCGSASISPDQLDKAIDFVRALEKGIRERVLKKKQPLVGTVELNQIYQSTAVGFVEDLFFLRYLRHNARLAYEAEDSPNDQTLFEIIVYALEMESDYNNPECADARDRIFSLLGLATDASEFDAFPDYSRTYEDVYEEITRKFLRQGRIDVFAFCQFPRKTGNRVLSTWAPDWSAPLLSPCTGRWWSSKYSVSGTTLSEQIVSFPDAHSVILIGIKIDTVERLGNIWDPDWTTPLDPGSTMRYLRDVRMLCNKSTRIEKCAKFAVAGQVAVRGDFCETHSEFVQDWERWEDPEDSSYLKDSASSSSTSDDSYYSRWQDPEECDLCLHCFRLVLKTLAGKTSGNQPSVSAIDQAYIDLYMDDLKTLHTRRPFLSKTGYVGLSPAGCVEGDVIVIFLGGKTPYVLRNRAEGGYTLVGEAYVHRIMHGEAMDLGLERETFTLY